MENAAVRRLSTQRLRLAANCHVVPERPLPPDPLFPCQTPRYLELLIQVNLFPLGPKLIVKRSPSIL
jgi:hypothetical protein